MAGTATARYLLPAALATLVSCGGDASGPTGARIDFLDGAIEPLVAPGQPLSIEGFGFGDSAGTVVFPRGGGGTVEVMVPPAAWTDLSVTTAVPADAASGTLTLRTRRGAQAAAQVYVIPAVPFDPDALAWQTRPDYAGAPAGLAVAAAEFPGTGGGDVTLFAVGGATVSQSGTALAPDSGVYVARVAAGGVPGPWMRQHDDPDPTLHRNLPVPRAFAAAAVATRHNSRFAGTAVYVLGGIDATGLPQATVYAADASVDGVVGRFAGVEPLPAPLVGAVAVVRRGRLYVMGGADATGHPGRRVFVGRIGIDGRIDGWFEQPMLPSARAYGGGVVLDSSAVVFGGVADSVPPGGGVDATPVRLVTSDTAPISLASGFFRGPWAPGPAALPAGRSQFATLVVGGVVLAVGGVYPGATSTPVETLAAALSGNAIGPFSGPVGTLTIHGQGGGTLAAAGAAAWRESDGTPHAVIVGGVDLVTREGRSGVWGF